MIILFSIFMLRGFAQESVRAYDIMQDIKDGKDVKYTNVTIVGELDFTNRNEKYPDLPSRSKWWNKGSNEVKESVDVSILFINCTFDDDVIAYIHEERSGYTFTADFEEDVVFRNCSFEQNAMFKYSNFDEGADFSRSKFQRKSTFKYAEFDNKANFANAYFENDATFKYAAFDEGASFQNAIFEESLNIKYMEAKGDFDIAGMDVQDDIDAKYTKINGKSFTNYLLESRN